MKNWINLTPHEVTILGGETPVVLPPSGEIARVAQTLAEMGTLAGVRAVRSTYGAVTGLPESSDGELYITSAMVRSAVPARRDVFSPADFVRSADGKIIGCRAMEGNQ